MGGATFTCGGDNASSTFNGVIKETGGLVKEGSGTLTLGGDNTFSGQLVINGGTVATSAGERLPDTCPLIINTGAFRLSSGQETIGSLSGGAGTSVDLGNATLVTGGNNSSTTYSGIISGNGGLTKEGLGILTLEGVNTYLGTTQVDAGILRLNGGDDRLSTATTLSVAAGAVCDLNGNNQSVATLTSTGTVTTGAGTLTVTGSLTPGSSPGVLTLGNFDLAASATMTADLAGTTAGSQYDQVIATGDVTLAGSLDLNLGFDPSRGQSFTIIDKTSPGAINGTFAGLAEGATLTEGSESFRISYVGGDGNDVVLTCNTTPTPTPTPGPTTLPPPALGPTNAPLPNISLGGPQLTWPHVNHARYYRIYRADSPSGFKEQVGRVGGESFTDDNARPGWVYYYFLRTENSGGLGNYSNWVPAWRYEQNPGRIGDYNGDGTSDILWWNKDSNQLDTWVMSQGQVQSSGQVGQGLDLGQWLLIGNGDYNGDGIGDLLWWSPQNGQATIWYLKKGDGTGAVMSQETLAASISGNATLPKSGDLDGDGRKDVMWCDYASGQTTLWLLGGGSEPVFNGPPSFQAGYTARLRGGADLAGGAVSQQDQPASVDLPGSVCNLQWQVAGLADVNGDGKDDVVWQHASDGRAAIWLMDGSQVTAVNEYQAQNAAGWRICGLGDMEGDGRADLVWQHQTTGAVKVWLMGADGGIGQERSVTLADDGASWQVKGLGDFDGDKHWDLLCKSSYTTEVRVVTLDSNSYDLAAR